MGRNINFKASITDKDIDSLKDAKQHFSDCYIMTTLETLSQTSNGRKVLKKQINRDDSNPEIINCYLYNKDGKREKFSVPTSFATNEYSKLFKYQPNEIVRSVNISVNEFEKKYKAKPFISQIRDNTKDYVFEYNFPSNFMKMITGVEPIVIGESNLNIDLMKYKDEVCNFLRGWMRKSIIVLLCQRE